MTIAPTPATADVNDSPSTSRVSTGWLAVLGRTVPKRPARPTQQGGRLASTRFVQKGPFATRRPNDPGRTELDGLALRRLAMGSLPWPTTEPCESHPRTDRQRIRSDEEDVRWAHVPDRGQPGRGSKRPRWNLGARRPCAVRRARRDDQSSPHGNARAANAGVATSRPGRCPQQTPARQVRGSRHDVRPLAACEAIDLKSPSQVTSLAGTSRQV